MTIETVLKQADIKFINEVVGPAVAQSAGRFFDTPPEYFPVLAFAESAPAPALDHPLNLVTDQIFYQISDPTDTRGFAGAPAPACQKLVAHPDAILAVVPFYLRPELGWPTALQDGRIKPSQLLTLAAAQIMATELAGFNRVPEQEITMLASAIASDATLSFKDKIGLTTEPITVPTEQHEVERIYALAKQLNESVPFLRQAMAEVFNCSPENFPSAYFHPEADFDPLVLNQQYAMTLHGEKVAMLHPNHISRWAGKWWLNFKNWPADKILEYTGLKIQAEAMCFNIKQAIPLDPQLAQIGNIGQVKNYLIMQAIKKLRGPNYFPPPVGDLNF